MSEPDTEDGTTSTDTESTASSTGGTSPPAAKGSSDQSASGTSPAGTEPRRDPTKRRIRTLSIFFLGIGFYAVVGFALETVSLFLDNLTTYFVSGGVVLAVGLVLLVLAR